MHPDVALVVTELADHRFKFEAFCRWLSKEELECPVPRSTWLARDFIAHLATIDEPVAGMFRAIHEGRETGIRTPDGAPFEVDRWNEDRIQERRARSLEELLGEAVSQRQKLLVHLEALDAADLPRKIPFRGDARRPAGGWELGRYLRGWCKHDVMHAVDMARAVPERVTPQVARWFDDPVVAGYQAMMNRDG